MIFAAIKLQRLVDAFIFLLNLLVVGQDIQGELPFLGIGALELKADGGNVRGIFSLIQGELVIISVALVFQEFQLVMGGGDELRLLVEIANRMLQFGLGCLQVGFGGTYIIFHLHHISFNTRYCA